MSKIFSTLILIFLYFIVFSTSHADDFDINIISRQEWGAIEEYRYLDSPEWQQILERWNNSEKKELTEYQKKRAQIEAEKVRKANNFLVNNYSDIIGVNRVVKEENNHKLAWPIAYSNQKVAIVIHHTDSEIGIDGDNYEAVRKIYKYHALTRAWGDIGYNYLIGTNGEIFEGRAGGDYAIGAHDKWNNQSTIGISLIGNYSNKKANKSQMESLEKLIKFLEKKYSIDFNKKQSFFKWCVGASEACIEKPLIIEKDFPIIGHKDAGHTACPGEKLYLQIQDLKKKLKVGEAEMTIKQKKLLKNIEPKLKSLPDYSKLEMLSKIELLLDKNTDHNSFFLAVKKIIGNYEVKKYIYDSKGGDIESFDDNNKIKVKLSYPDKDNISFIISKDLTLDFIKNQNEYILDFKDSGKGNKKDSILYFELSDNKLFMKNTEIVDFNKINFLRIRVPEDRIIKINSWDRKPTWDKSGKLNDNEFRGDIVLYTKDNKLVVVNDILLGDYLKGLGEVSNGTNPEKVRVIIILARTYARWYMTKARKFAGEWFDASDNPNVFQKYLGFGLEKRSENINEIVEETKDLIVTFDGELIKPWYFSSSDGETTSFSDYCENAKGVPDCSHPEKFPFLVGVTDNGGKGKAKAGHGVGVPGTGVEYFSKRGWSFDMIIKYFLKGVEIEKKI